jgi:hypothetical protein
MTQTLRTRYVESGASAPREAFRNQRALHGQGCPLSGYPLQLFFC